MDQKQLSSSAKKSLLLVEFDQNEQVMYEIRKHRFGLLLTLITGLFIAVAVMVVTIFAVSYLSSDKIDVGTDLSTFRAIIGLVGFLVVILDFVGICIASYLYVRNVILVTTDKIVEISYFSLFNRKITQLSLDDIQDVAVQQIGVFARIFNYGTLVIETAGEHENVLFTFAPLPYQCAKQIVAVRENMEKSQRANYPVPPIAPPIR